MPAKRGNRSFGNLGEVYAVALLRKKGYQIVVRNFRSKFGEIDIVATHKNTLVFIEVKTRWSRKYGKPEEAVTKRKLEKIAKTAAYFSLLYPNFPKKQLIQVIAIEIQEGKVASAKIFDTY